MLFNNEKIDEILAADSIAIYGAGLMGKTLLKCLNSSTYNKKVDAFIVRDKEENPEYIEDVLVLDMDHAHTYKSKLVLVALHEKNIYSALEELKEKGFTKVLPISFDSDLWTDLRGNWMKDEGIGFREDTEVLDTLHGRTNIYVVHSSADKKLMEDIQDKVFETSILVGAALSSGDEYTIHDNMGENISEKNKEYCELTALYWIWKNDHSKYVGLSHYRRRFVFDEYGDNIFDNKVDVVVTVPMINIQTVREQYALDHSLNDWNIMLEAIRNLYPEYYETADEIQNGYYYYAYNMFIARKEILDEYCKWLFDILNYCDQRIKLNDDKYQRRYAGFLAERLMTIYLVHNKQYKIAVARKHFIESE